MKLHFDPDLPYQHQAIEAVCDLFRGQETCRTEFTVTRNALGKQRSFAFHQESEHGIGNRLTLLDDELHKNLNDIQLKNGLPHMLVVNMQLPLIIVQMHYFYA